MLKKILSVLAAFIVIFAIIVAIQPSEFRVERSATISAPAEIVFAQVNELKKWDAWSPWKKLDPEAAISYEGPESGAGAIAKWSGNSQVGEGTMTLTESRPNEIIKIKTDMTKPMESSNMTEFLFAPDGDQTRVTWIVSGHQGFVAKALCLVFNGKQMLGDALDEGLGKLKTVAESAKTS